MVALAALDAITVDITITVDANATTTESVVVTTYSLATTSAPHAAHPNFVLTTGTTPVVIASPGSAGDIWTIANILIYNADTVSHTYTIKITNGTLTANLTDPFTLATLKSTTVSLAGGSSSGASGHTIRVNGTDMATEAALNFVFGMTGGLDDSGNGETEIHLSNPLFGGRLSLSSTLPVPTSDLTAQGTLYYLPYNHDFLPIWDGNRWQMFDCSGLSGLSLSLTSGKNYDVFMRWNGGTPLIALSSAWTNDTTRADALAVRDGISVLNSDNTYVHLGTIRASAANQCEDSEAKRFVSNLYNEVEYDDFRNDTTDSWTNSGNGTWAAVNSGNAAWKHEFVRCRSGKPITAFAHYATSAGGVITVAIDSTSTPDKTKSPYGSSNTNHTNVVSVFADYPSIGYHYIQALETTWTVASATSYGDNGTNPGSNAVGYNAGLETKGYR